ncbi:cytidine/deoxycytidylate deaminase family protein [Streptacidiphilus sp. N1-12]|uniref:Cytidine/deoxycytidylate deaminase family protein n=2 Tax=Streptacidiphilus alkalitolerans TaxID=3342712 RepID=A0ABV6WCN0_9ACTN
MKQVLLYLPVFHAGYEALFTRHADAAGALLLGESFADDHPVLKKEIRALSSDTAARALKAATGLSRVTVVERVDLPAAVVADTLVVPDEELMRDIVVRYRLDQGRTVVYERTFLRWDRSWSQVQRPAEYDGIVATDELSRSLLGRAAEEAGLSSDWWRQVGAVAVRDGEVIDVAHNQHRPTEYTPYLDGDPRNDFSRGLRMDLSTAIHAEAMLVARAAGSGVPLAGADLYVSTFPCPACARLVAEAGFRRCFFAGPYAVLDGDAILRAAGVELIWVDTSAAGNDESVDAADATPAVDVTPASGATPAAGAN